jgi:hypothetical protein
VIQHSSVGTAVVAVVAAVVDNVVVIGRDDADAGTTAAAAVNGLLFVDMDYSYLLLLHRKVVSLARNFIK